MKLSQWLGLAIVVIVAVLLWQVRQLLLLLFLAIIFTIALNRLVQFLERKFDLQRRWASFLAILVTVLVVLLFFRLVVPPFLEQFQSLVALAPRTWVKVRDLAIALQQKELEWGLPLVFRNDNPFQPLQSLGPQLFKNFFAFFSNSAIAALQILFVVTLAVMMLRNPQSYRRAMLKLFPAFYRRRADQIFTLSEAALGNWLTGIMISSCFIAAMSGLGLWALQIKLVLVHALMAGILNFIPNIGPAASVVFPIMIALLDDPWKIGAVLILYFIIQNIESYWLTPIVMAKQVSLLPAVTLMAQLFFASLFGILGLLLALPLTVIVKTWVEEALFKDILDQWT